MDANDVLKIHPESGFYDVHLGDLAPPAALYGANYAR